MKILTHLDVPRYDRSVMHTALPKKFSAVQLARSGESLKGSVELAALPRLAATVSASTDGTHSASASLVSLSVRAGIDDSGAVRLRGRVQARLTLQCQRCLEGMLVELQSEVQVAVVGSEEQEDRLPAGLEALVVPDGKVDLYRMLEDEVLLAMPAVPLHEASICKQPGFPHDADDFAGGGGRASAENPSYRRPLAELSNLLKARN